MEKFIVEGGVPLKGEVEVSGAKNASLPLFAACLLLREPVVLRNVPHVKDVNTMLELLSLLGARIEKKDRNTYLIDAKNLSENCAPYEIVKRMRASIYVLGPIMVRKKEARVSLPGGCAFGPRPVDFHIKGLKILGASIRLEHGYIVAKKSKLRGGEIFFDIKSVGATAHLMMVASAIEEKTTIRNAAKEPEIVSLAKFLRRCGAQIKGEGTDEITIEGVSSLHSPGEYAVIPDRIETGTFAVGTFMTKGEVLIKNCNPNHLHTVLEKLKEAGANLEKGKNWIFVSGGKEIRPLKIVTSPYPGFPTDLQAQFMAMMTIARGTSIIKEGIYPDRFKHAFELMRLGADIKVEGDTAFVHGKDKLMGAPVMSSDLRASAALVLAGLVAEGTTVVERIYHLERGYENFQEKLSSLGANIVRIS